MSYVMRQFEPGPAAQTPEYYGAGARERTLSDAEGEEYQQVWPYWRDFVRGRVRARRTERYTPDRDSDYALENKTDFADEGEEWL